jgi:heat shock protein HslJ
MRNRLQILGLVLVLGAVLVSGCAFPVPTATPGVAAELVGTDWTLVSLAGQPLIEDTAIGLRFEKTFLGGRMTCNGYGGTPDTGKYAATTDGRFTPPEFMAVTVQLCSEPEGLMDQEAAYVKALQSTTAYRLDGDRLELRNALGETILVFISGEEP